jgi:ABC-type branched-subunit amino acid transport system substrate-binding protein
MIEDRGVGKQSIISAFVRAFIVAPALALAGCLGVGGDAPTPDVVVTQQPLPQEATVIGDGGITVAMLLPLSAGGSASGLAQSFQNAAELAMDEVAEDNIRIVVRDTAGDEDTARMAAEAAVTDGAQLILGPVFAPAVRGVGDPARASAVPVIAFSTDSSVSGRGVYLLSFLPRQDATRVVEYASQEDVGAFAALVPDNGYGLVMEAAFREAVAANGGRTVAVERYAPGEIDAAVDRLTGRGAFEAVFVPNGGDDPAAAAAALSRAGIDARLLGSGQWANEAVIAAPGLEGAWYPAPSGGGYDAFAERYRSRFGAAPPRTASLVYDAALLANGLVGARGPAAFRPSSLQANDGFLGLDGIFRLTSEGLSERGLAVYQVGPGGSARVVSPAPDKFPQSF